jgi:hypothetical protein
MAVNIFYERQDSDSKPRRGPKVRIDNYDELWGDRDQLLGQLENNWHSIGGKLASIKRPTDVVEVFSVLAKNHPAYVVRILLRPTSTPADGPLLQKARNQVGKLNATRMSAMEHKEKCRRALEAAENVANRILSEHDRILVEEAKAKRAGELAQADKELTSAASKHADAEKLLADGETYFARKEVINFCRSRRYMLNLINTANALAGLPRVGSRRSIALCQNQKPAGANGGTIQIFNSILRIVRSSVRKSQLVKHAENWLKHSPFVASEAYGVSALCDDWFYLRWAIKTAVEAKVRSRDLPFAITQEYWKRKENASPVERLLAQDESIIVLSRRETNERH